MRKETMSETQTKFDRLKEIAQTLGDKLKKNKDNIALLIFGSVATRNVGEKGDLDLLLISQRETYLPEPQNVEEKVVSGEIVQISNITPKQLEEDIIGLVDYRVNQIQEGIIVFDKEGLIQKIKKNLEEIVSPPKNVLKTWLSDLKEDFEILPQKISNKAEFLFLTNRSALWALRIFLSLKGTPFRGPKYIEEQLADYPQIKNLFLNAFGGESINLKIKSNLKDVIPSGEDNIYLFMIRDMLTDSDELEGKKKNIAAKTTFLEAVTYFGLYLQEKEGLENWEELFERNRLFAQLIKQTFGEIDLEVLLKDNLKFNQIVTSLVQNQLESVHL